MKRGISQKAIRKAEGLYHRICEFHEDGEGTGGLFIKGGLKFFVLSRSDGEGGEEEGTK